ncbi:4-alpha-glucanotransferase [Desulforhopalus sp. 52FAK]
MIPERSSGILAHITSLPSPFGIGDLGPSCYEFLDFLNNCQQTYWQFLPTNPTNGHFDYSPYMANSAFAGNPHLISPELLLQAGYIEKSELDNFPPFSPYIAELDQVVPLKTQLLKKAFIQFSNVIPEDYNDFLTQNSWLNDYSIFMVAKEIYNNQGWFSWPAPLAKRDQTALDNFKEQHQSKINYYNFEQYEYFRQWRLLQKESRSRDIQLFGDLPIYVSYDSVDVWANQDLFTLDPQSLKPTHVSGVPPDYFSKTGQRWGNPLYNWQSKSKDIQGKLVTWWTERLRHLFTQVDIARIDHFRGFESYWTIPEENEDATTGVWLKGPGKVFFNEIESRLGKMNIIAEDLGIITEEVVKLRDALHFPGMKVLQFAFDGNPENSFLPHNFETDQCVVYTGTHDNDTTMGWFLSEQLNEKQRNEVKLSANRSPNDASPINKDMMYLAQASISKLCIFPLQDVLGFGNDCKMNSPGEPKGNWRWRCSKEFLSEDVSQYLAQSTIRFGRNRKEKS